MTLLLYYTNLPGLVSDSATNDSKKGKVSLNKGFEVWEKNRSQAAAGPFPSNTFAQMLDFVTYLLGRSTNDSWIQEI